LEILAIEVRKEKQKAHILKINARLVAHACNPSYLGS
jgi:hypothetical protein